MTPSNASLPEIIRQSKIAPHDVLKKSHSLSLHQLLYHIAQDRADGVETLVCLTDVGQTHFVEQNLLDDKDGDCLGELGTCLHDTEAQWDDLRGEKEIDNIGVVILLDEGTDNSKRCEAKVLERACLGSCVEEWIEEKGNMGLQEETSSVVVGCDALQECKCIAYPV